jgi:uncharacterized protein YigE (DUF2233 family)
MDQSNRTDIRGGRPRQAWSKAARFVAALALIMATAAGCNSPDWPWLQNESGPLWVQVGSDRWKRVDVIERGELYPARDMVLADKRVAYSRIHLRRSRSFRLNVFEFSAGAFDFGTLFKPQFELATVEEISRDRKNLVFIINANYFDEKFRPLGWVVHGGKSLNREASRLDGYFMVMGDGRLVVGSRARRERVRGEIREAIQSFPLLMENFVVNDDVLAGEQQFANADEKTWRVIIGQLQDGRLIFMASDAGCTIDLREMVQLAAGMNVKNAMALDGGGSLQYLFRYGDTEHQFSVHARRVPVFIEIAERGD